MPGRRARRTTTAVAASCLGFWLAIATPALAGTVIYTYDALNRLIQVDYGTGAGIVYTYDAVGNRLSRTATSPTAVLAVTMAGSGLGSVRSSPGGIGCGPSCEATFSVGARVTLTAGAAPGSIFTGWSGDCSGTGACEMSMDAARSVTATFGVETFTVTVQRGGAGGGSVKSDPLGIDCGDDCQESYASGTNLTLAAIPATGSTFTGWSGPCSGTGTCTVEVGGPLTVEARFDIQSFDLTASTTGGGAGSVTSDPPGIACGTDCVELYPFGTTVTLLATPTGGSTFAGWSGDCLGTGICILTMDVQKSVVATFAQDLVALTVSRAGTGGGMVRAEPDGIDCGSRCAANYQRGLGVSLTATPDPGSALSSWAGCDSVSGDRCRVAMTAARTVSVAFVPAAPHLGPGEQQPFGVVLTCPGTAPRGGVVTVTATFANATDTARTVMRGAVAFHAGRLRLLGPKSFPISATIEPGILSEPSCPGCPAAVLPTRVTVPLQVIVPPQAETRTFLTVGMMFFGREGDATKRRPLVRDACVIEVE